MENVNKILATIEFTDGKTIALELYPDAAPITVANFAELCKAHFYDGLCFHRVIDGFMIQGGGFVFDCRALHNPGCYERYRQLTGMDSPVIEFLDAEPEVAKFLESVYSLVDASVERYISRGFTSLSVAFGCTGGRHRSVYCAEHLAAHLAAKYRITVELKHREQKVSKTLESL